MTGGYKIIDLGYTNFTTTKSATVPGIYEKIKSARKAILLEHFSIGGTDCRPCFPEITVSGNSFTFDVYGKTFTVANTDAVTVATKG